VTRGSNGDKGTGRPPAHRPATSPLGCPAAPARASAQ